MPYALQAEEAKNADTLDGQDSNAFWQLGGNAGTTPGTHFLGTTDNVSLTLRVNNAGALRLEPDPTSPNVIGGHGDNYVQAGVRGGTISGGGTSNEDRINRVTDYFGTVGGGRSNQAGDGVGLLNNALCATVAGGDDNVAYGYWSFIGGGKENWAGQVAVVGGGTKNVVSATTGFIGAGWGNVITGTNMQYDSIVGGHHNKINGVSLAFIGGGESNTITGTGGASVIGGGEGNTASGTRSTIGGGESNIASGRRSTVGGGRDNIASGLRATVGGGYGNTASADYATVSGGYGALTSHYGEMAYASGQFATAGDAQTSVYVLRQTTTTSETRPLHLDGDDERLTIPVSRTVTFDILITAAADNGDAAAYQYVGGIKRTSSGTSLIGSVVELMALEDDLSWAVGIGAPNHYLRINVTGVDGRTIHWVATVRTVETMMP